MKRKPVIGLTMRLEIETNRFYLGRDYCEALEGLGAIPLHLGLIPEPQYIREVIDLVDGILLPGSDTDVDPLKFKEEPHPRLKKIVPEKDSTDLLVIEAAERKGLPILGICYGMQILNVSRGGSLIQDIESEIKPCLKHEQGVPLARNSHTVSIETDSLAGTICGQPTVRVNSHHHQAVKAVGMNLKATAFASDGIIEAVEDVRPGKFVLGVQWHPELNWKSDEFSRGLFESFIKAC